jgi:hypothetical protein
MSKATSTPAASHNTTTIVRDAALAPGAPRPESSERATTIVASRFLRRLYCRSVRCALLKSKDALAEGRRMLNFIAGIDSAYAAAVPIEPNQVSLNRMR